MAKRGRRAVRQLMIWFFKLSVAFLALGLLGALQVDTRHQFEKRQFGFQGG